VLPKPACILKPIDLPLRSALSIPGSARSSPPTEFRSPANHKQKCQDCSLTKSLLAIQQKAKERDLALGQVIREKTELLGTAAHDLRNPVLAICSYSEMLSEVANKDFSPEQLEMVRAIHSIGEYTLRLVEDTLEMANVECGNARLNATLSLLAPLVAETISMSRPLATRKEMHLTLTGSGEPHLVLLDPVKIKRALGNLIENAIKYCQPGAHIHVHISRLKDSVRVSVEDDGPGIDPADFATLFIPFQRSRTRARSNEPGTGLGLTIAKQIVELHGGRIWAESRVARGTSFHVRLPAQPRTNSKKS
jgi:signal transduction histidine kinase